MIELNMKKADETTRVINNKFVGSIDGEKYFLIELTQEALGTMTSIWFLNKKKSENEVTTLSRSTSFEKLSNKARSIYEINIELEGEINE